ncbi:MAG TPA: extracellular solute-binding protein [Candidatus Krumholzibacteria bacterium]|nr:extracellular solute-binding protein [Candidatus Krumholzibacteria bacterium]
MTFRSGRRAAGAAASLALALALCACGKKANESATTIRFWQFWDVGVVAPIVEEFEKQNPGVHVEVEQLTWATGLEKIQAALASGTQPDVCELGSTWLPRFSYEGVLEDLTSVYQAERDSFLLWDSAMWKGNAYGLPWLQGSRALFYNRDLFRQAGLDPDHPPDTWDELLDASRRIRALGQDVYGFGQNIGEKYVLYKKFMAFAWGNGGDVFDAQGHVAINSPAMVEALEFYLKLAPYSLQEKQEVLDQYFKTGKLGMQVSGAWNLKNYALEAPNLDYGVALVPRPAAGRGEHASFAGAEMLVVFRGSKQRDAAVRLARFLQAYPQARAVSLAAGSVFPASREAMDDTTFTNDPRVRVFVEQSLTSHTPPAHPGWVEMEDVIDHAVEECMYGRRAPRWCLDDAAKQIAEIAARFDNKQGTTP